MQYHPEPEYKLMLVIEEELEKDKIWKFPDYANGGLPISHDLAAKLAAEGSSLQKEGNVFLYTIVNYMREQQRYVGW